MRARVVSLITAGAVLAVAAVAAFAGPGDPPGRGGRGFGGPGARLLRADGRLAAELKLSETQRQKLRDIGDGLARAAIRNRADAAVARLDLARLLREDSPDRSRIGRQIDLLGRLRADRMKAMVLARLDARAVLTPEQRRQLEEWRGPGGVDRDGGRHGNPR